MTTSIAFARADGGAAPDTVTPVGTTQTGGAPALTGEVNFCPAAAGATAVTLPYRAQPGVPVTVINTASTATALTVFPPMVPAYQNNLGSYAAAASGGSIYGTGAVSANASISIPQYKSATFWPHANGIDFSVVIGA
jgi:hypothetical protein